MITSRRDFLLAISRGAMVLGALPLLNACGGITRAELTTRPELPRLDPMTADILYHASLAPSGHNTQPWTVSVVEPYHWTIGRAENRRLPAVDPENRELMLSIGAFLESMITAAGHYGYGVEYEVIAETPMDINIIDVRLKTAAPVSFPLEKLRLRRTVRSGLLTGELNSVDVKALSRPFGARIAYFPRDSREGRYLEEGTIEANRLQACRDKAQEELADWIRWKDDDARRHRNGLTPEGMEITGVAGWYARRFMDRSDVLKKNFRKQGLKIVRKQVETCGGWLVVTSSDSAVSALIETGRLFERMFLNVRERMIAIHPMTQMLEETPIREQAAKELRAAGHVQFILRTGYLKSYPEPVSLRMPLTRFVTVSLPQRTSD